MCKIDTAGMNRVENVFQRTLTLVLLPNRRLKSDGDLKTAFSIQYIMTTMSTIEVPESQVAS